MNLFSLASWTWFWETINSLLLVLCNWVYSLVGVIYQVFLAIARVNLFDAATFEKITKRIYIVIGIAMLFIFAYNIILMIINPEDKKTTGNTGKLVKETIISFTLIILLPTIFDYMYRFQNNLLESNIIGQIILGPVGSTGTDGQCKAGDYDCTCDFTGYKLEDYSENKWFWPKGNTSDDEKKILENACNEYKNLPGSVRGAYAVAPTILAAFYSPANFTLPECVSYLQKGTGIDDNDDKQICINYFYDVTASKYTGNIKPFVYDTYLKNIASDSNKTNIEFNGLMGLLAGGLAAWMFICYALEIGVRVAKLGVLQLLSPIAVMMRVVPKQKEAMYDKWLKNLTSTYIDVFIRLFIIYFSLFAISLVEGVLDNLFASLGTIEGSNVVATYGIRALAAVVVILGILKFAQEAPDLIKDFFGNSGKFALKSPRKQLSDNKLAMAGMGMARAGFGGASRNMFKSIREGNGFWKTAGSTIGGLVGGAKRGAITGYGSTMDNIGRNTDRAIEETTEKRSERARYKALHGGTIRGAMLGHAKDSLSSVNSWIGRDPGRDILESIAYEEDVIKHYADYETMYKSGGYDAMDARLKEMKAAKSAGGSFDGMKGDDLKNAIKELEVEMRKKRTTAIENNVQNAGYVAYEFAQSIFSNEKEYQRIKAKFQHEGQTPEQFEEFISQLRGLDIKKIDGKDTVVDKNGVAVSKDLIVNLLEGAGPEQGLNGASGALKGQLSADKLSVAYKHQTKLEQERKEKDSKK